jgi:glycosyltransferase involved in cell wall biosynthesis
MSSWIRDAPKKAPKKAEPFVRLGESVAPSEAPPDIVPYPIPSALFAPGQRVVVPSRLNESRPTAASNPITIKPEPVAPAVVQMEAPADINVSIVIPLYNGVEFLEDALQSVKRQTYKNWDCLIGVNGHGQTGEPVLTKAMRIVQKLALENRVRVLNLPEAVGGAQAINALVAETTVQYIAHLDADDIWLPKKLEIQMAAMTNPSDFGIVGTWCRYFGESTSSPNLPGGALRRTDFYKTNPLIHSSILIKRDLANYTDEFVTYDYDCWIRNVINDVKIFNVNSILVLHRIHKASFYNSSKTQQPELVREKYNFIDPTA